MTTSSIGSSSSPLLVLLHDDARTRHGELEAFAAHRLDQHGKLQFAAAGDEERILLGRFLDLQRDIAFGLAHQAVADDAAGDLVALGAGERAVVDDEGHGDGRRIDRLRMQRLGDGRIAERVGDGALGQAGDGDDVAGLRLVDRLALEAAEGEDLGDAAGFDAASRHWRSTLTGWFDFSEPDSMRPVMMRPRNGLASRSVPIMRNGPG